MKSLVKPFFSLLLFSIFSFIFASTCLNDNASAQSCDITICKTAEGAGDLLFPFTVDQGGMISEFNLIGGGLCRFAEFSGATDIDIVEGQVPGWVLSDVQCEVSGLTITSIENGINIVCDEQISSTGTCTFINVQGVSPTNIPTLSEWGMIAAAAGLGVVGLFFALRRRRLQAGA